MIHEVAMFSPLPGQYLDIWLGCTVLFIRQIVSLHSDNVLKESCDPFRPGALCNIIEIRVCEFLKQCAHLITSVLVGTGKMKRQF